ncbi:MAG: reverse transcriptase/maturase family protein [bacterium]|nr:reverse transcriptase/maturase family protein [bacterium]
MIMKIELTHKFEDIVSLENLLEAWREFIKGKRQRRDVQEFSFSLMDNILSLHFDLVNHTYRHGSYQAFNICDPKPRNIHKASVRDRLLHHAIHRKLYPFFDRTFIADSFSCRKDKGTHRAINRFRAMTYKVSQNNTKTCWVLKCDIKKFFASIDQRILLDILREYISEQQTMWLLGQVVSSFAIRSEVGLPLGNSTSQLFVNIYMNKFDQFVKHKLKVRHYIRYADDFVFLSEDRIWLESIRLQVDDFLEKELGQDLHPNKVFIKTVASGVDFLGWIQFLDHRILRTSTERRMLKRVQQRPASETINSYFGLLKHGNAQKIKQRLTRLIDL